MGRMSDAGYGDTPAPDRYPAKPGYKETTTSKLAAEAIAPDAATIRAAVLDAIGRQPSTADEVAAALGLSILTVRPRGSELRNEGKIRPHRDAGGKPVRRPNDSGATAIVWEVVP